MMQNCAHAHSASGGQTQLGNQFTSACSGQGHERAIANWLLVCALLVFCMILLGGATRLTQSGLSIVEWKPLVGTLPPLSEAGWQAEFDLYKQFPEYQKVNAGMDLAGFKSIYWFEYLHRLLGRLIGLAFLLPLLFFWASGRIPPGLAPKLFALFVLGGLQGVLGWYMVKSGLVDNPRVSHYRLTAHLGAAVLLYGCLLWVALSLRRGGPVYRSGPAQLARGLVALLFLMILSGGLVAGTRAGFVFNTFPLMGDSFVPPGIYTAEPFWLSMFEDLATIQFNHRLFAYLLILLIGAFAVSLLRRGLGRPVNTALYCLLAALVLQVALGIATLLLQVPVVIATAHQGGAVLLFSAALLLAHALAREPAVARA